MRRGTGTRGRGCMRVAAAAALALPLWLAACDGLPGPAASAPAGTAGSPAAAPGAQVPAPRPQEPPPAGVVAAATAATPTGPTPAAPNAEPEALAAGGGTGQSGSAPGPPGAASAGAAPAAGTTPAGPAGPSPAPSPEAPASGGTAAPARSTVTAYFVLLDDGGSNGVRFGCNDSLVGLQQAALEGKDPLPSAVKALLASGSDPAPQAPEPTSGREVYNALAGSRLKFLSGTFDGSTVTVYLSGALSLSGVCDIPRLEAQLTQTALAAVGG